MTKMSKSGILLAIFAVYILIQFLWWAYLLFNLNTDYYQLKQELYVAWKVTPDLSPQEELAKKRIMIFGEGFIFFSLLLTGIILSARFLKRDLALSRMQRNFMLSVSHELKTPIASIQLYLQTLLTRQLEEPKRKEMLDRALNDNHRLQKLVDKLLLATQLDNQGLQLNRELVDLNAVIQKSLKTIDTLDQGIHPITSSLAENCQFMADEMAIEAIVMNLLENAIKYAPPSSPITITSRKEGNDLQLEVSNNGSIAPEEQKLIFSKFYRIGNEATRTTKGTGIGLYLVKSLVDLHNGKIELITKKGTVTFKITFRESN
jgi:two-component system phosphate regulon sensor histidine kinase PhoR